MTKLSILYFCLLFVVQLKAVHPAANSHNQNESMKIIELLRVILKNLRARQVWCDRSDNCGNAGFCNFDYHNYGICEYCSDIPYSCAQGAFETYKGVLECKAVCGISGRVDCTSSYECGNLGFCNFDFGGFGSCEACFYQNKHGIECQDYGLRTQRGRTECISKCKETSSKTTW